MFLEYIIIGGLIIFQFFIAWNLWGKINLYKSIFKNLPNVEQKLVSLKLYNEGNIQSILTENTDPLESKVLDITILKNNSKNKVLGTILYQINSYLIKNNGATIDFHLIKDTVDRNIEIIEEDINNRIPAPLYIGLAATMLGIIFGLFLVNFDASDTALNAIQPLIDGVKIAMTASVLGLIITTVFSVKIFKDANFKVEEEKNYFLSQIQSDLLPRMNKSKMPEVEILSKKLDHFSRNTSGSITKLDTIVQATSFTVQREQQLIKDIKRLDITKMTTANIEVFNQLEEMMGSFNNFANYYNQLNSSMKSTSELLSNLERFVASTNNINTVLEGIKETIAQSNSATEFFNSHIQSFSKYGEAVDEAVINANSKMIKAISELGRLTEEQFNSFNEAVANFDAKLTSAFNHSIEKFTNAMNEQVIRSELVFENNRPKFEKLNKLDHLEIIDKRLVSLEEKITKVFNSNSKEIIAALRETYSPNNQIINEKGKVLTKQKKSIFNNVLTMLKTGAYIVIIIYGTHTFIQYFNLMN